MWPTILVGSAVGAVFLAIVISSVIGKIKGKPSCGGNCSSCNLCHRGENTEGQ